jgi:hypothetical protein
LECVGKLATDGYWPTSEGSIKGINEYLSQVRVGFGSFELLANSFQHPDAPFDTESGITTKEVVMAFVFLPATRARCWILGVLTVERFAERQVLMA